mgnify:CR=1 FL=1
MMRYAVFIIYLFITGCSGVQIHSSIKHHAISLQAGDLEQNGLAFLTPTTPTGQEEDKQALAFVFADVMGKLHQEIRIVTLPDTLGQVNRADLADAYREMYDEYRSTGILNKKLLSRISQMVETRYLALINLGKFTQGTNTRFGVLGLRLIDTKFSNMRLFLQIWDGRTGGIAWEGYVEVNYSDETFSEQPISFRQIMIESAQQLIATLPTLNPPSAGQIEKLVVDVHAADEDNE